MVMSRVPEKMKIEWQSRSANICKKRMFSGLGGIDGYSSSVKRS